MKKAYKITAYVVSTILCLFIALLLYIFIQIDPNDFRDEFNDLLQEHVHAQLHIDGKISWASLPWRGLSVHDITLDNPLGFGQQPFAHIEELRFTVKLLPLLNKHLAIKAIHLRGMHIRLAKQANDESNWQLLLAEPSNTPHTSSMKENSVAKKHTPSTPTHPPKLSLAQLQISDSDIQFYQNEQLHWVIDNISMQGKSDPVHDHFPIDIQATLHDQMIHLHAIASAEQQRYQLQSIQIDSDHIHAKGDFSFDPSAKQWQRFHSTGTVSADNLQCKLLTLDQLQLQWQLRDSQLQIKPVDAKLYGGTYHADFLAKLDKTPMQFTLHQQLAQLPSQKVFELLAWQSHRLGTLAQVIQHIPISGQLDLTSTLQTQGINPDQLLNSLQGKAKFSFSGGSISGFDGAMVIAEGLARLAQPSIDQTKRGKQTEFSKLTGSLTIDHGIVHNNDLLLDAKLLQLSGAGTFNLPANHIDYRFTGQRIKSNGDVDKHQVPFRLRGALNHPKLSLDIKSLLKQRVNIYQQRLNKEIHKVFDGDLLKKLKFH